MSTDDEEARLLFAPHVAEVFSELAGKPISPHTVTSYRRQSWPADPERGRHKDGRFYLKGDPFPPEAGVQGRSPYWYPEQIPDLTAWWNRQHGRFGDPRRA